MAAGGTDCKEPAPKKINNNLTITILLTLEKWDHEKLSMPKSVANNYEGVIGASLGGVFKTQNGEWGNDKMAKWRNGKMAKQRITIWSLQRKC